MPLCLTNSSVSSEASTETYGEKALRIRSRISLSPLGSRAERAGEGDLTVDPAGKNTEPLATPVVGVIVPLSLGERGFGCMGRDVVEAKRFESEALERLYGSLVTGARGDFAGLAFGTAMFASPSES